MIIQPTQSDFPAEYADLLCDIFDISLQPSEFQSCPEKVDDDFWNTQKLEFKMNYQEEQLVKSEGSRSMPYKRQHHFRKHLMTLCGQVGSCNTLPQPHWYLWSFDPHIYSHIKQSLKKTKTKGLSTSKLVYDVTGLKIKFTYFEMEWMMRAFKMAESEWISNPIPGRKNFVSYSMLIEYLMVNLSIELPFQLPFVKQKRQRAEISAWLNERLPREKLEQVKYVG